MFSDSVSVCVHTHARACMHACMHACACLSLTTQRFGQNHSVYLKSIPKTFFTRKKNQYTHTHTHTHKLLFHTKTFLTVVSIQVKVNVNLSLCFNWAPWEIQCTNRIQWTKWSTNHICVTHNLNFTKKMFYDSEQKSRNSQFQDWVLWHCLVDDKPLCLI
jgi:hypothetical protein